MSNLESFSVTNSKISNIDYFLKNNTNNLCFFETDKKNFLKFKNILQKKDLKEIRVKNYNPKNDDFWGTYLFNGVDKQGLSLDCSSSDEF